MGSSRTVRDLVSRSARISTVVGMGEVLDADDAEDILESLNLMIDAWQADRLYAFQINESTVALNAGDSDYTIGPGQEIDVSVRPVKLEYAFTRDAQNYDRKMRVLHNREEYANLFLKTLDGAYPVYAYLDPGWPVGTIYVWPLTTPSVPLTLHVGIWNLITEFPSLEPVVSLPPGYEDAIVYSLAERVCTEFEKPINKDLEKMASLARARIKRMNVPASRTVCEFQGTSRSNMIPWWVVQGGGP